MLGISIERIMNKNGSPALCHSEQCYCIRDCGFYFETLLCAGNGMYYLNEFQISRPLGAAAV